MPNVTNVTFDEHFQHNHRHDRTYAIVFSILGVVLLLTSGGWSLGIKSLWAFSHLIYEPFFLRISLAATLLIASVAVTFSVNRATLDRFGSRLALPTWSIILASAAIFWLLRERTFHGDALRKLELLSTQSLRSDPFVWKEPLDSLIAYSAAALFTLWGLSAEHSVATTSVLAGAFYVAAILYLVSLLSDRQAERIVYFVALLALGSSQLWFGHIENYSMVTAATMWSIALAVAFIQGRGRLWLVGIVSGIAVSLHPQAAFMLPALLVALKRPLARNVTILLLSVFAPIIATIVMVSALGAPPPSLEGGYAGDSQLFWTFSEALRYDQLQQDFNNLWLLVPILPLSLIAFYSAVTTPDYISDSVARFFCLLALGMLTYHIVFKNDLPRHRDWDLYAIVGPSVALWIVYTLLRTGWTRTLAVGLVFSVLFTASWIGINHTSTLVQPVHAEKPHLRRYLADDLITELPYATVFPTTPICAETEGCERVTSSRFSMPQDGDTCETIFAHAPAHIEFATYISEQESFLWLSPALDPAAWSWGGDGVTFEVAIRQGDEESTLWSRHLDPRVEGDLGWQDALISLDDHVGENIILILRTLPGPDNNADADRAGWGEPWLMNGTLDERFYK